jgi:cobalt/nickel transport system permease protein
MDIARIDYWAVHGRSRWHRASPVSKLLGAAALVGAVAASTSPFVLLALYLSVLAAVVSTGLPALRIALIAAYPGIFALLFAVSQWTGNPVVPAVIILKALGASLTMLLVITTTPYPALFAVLQRGLPRSVVAGLFLTYRSLFLLLALWGHLWTALALRGGLPRRRPWVGLANLASGLGLLFVRALALSERFHAVLLLRGYRGVFTNGGTRLLQRGEDLLPLVLGGVLLGAALADRFVPTVFGPYNGYLLGAALLALLVAWLVRRPAQRRPL